jgi:hypothetical protein
MHDASFVRWSFAALSLVLAALTLVPSPALAQPRPPSLLGCDITIDLNTTFECLQAAVNREVRKAEANAKAQAEQSPHVAHLDWQKEILRQVRSQSALFACLDQPPSFNFVGAVQQAAANPAAFAQAQLRTAIAQARPHWTALLKPELDALAAGRVPAIDSRTAVPTATARLAQATQSMPGARCLFQHIPPALQAQAAAVVGEMSAALEQEMRAVLVTHVLPQVRTGIAAQMRSGYRELGAARAAVSAAMAPVRLEERVPFLKGLTLTEAEIKTIARGVLMERKYQAVFRSGADALGQLAGVLANGASPAETLEVAKQKAMAALTPTDDWQRLYVAIGLEMVRAVGHKYIDSDQPGHGGALLNHAMSLVQFAEGTVEKAVVAVCGLVPEAGAAGCAVVEEAVNLLWNAAAVPGLEAVASDTIHDAWNTAVDRVRGELERGGALEEIKGRLGRLDAFIASLPHEAALAAWAGDMVKQDKERVDNHLASVRALVKEVRR